MKSFTVNRNDAGQRLDKFTSKAAPSLPMGMMYKYIRIKRIKVNGGRAEISTRLREGDRVDMYINDEFFERQAPKYDFLSAPAEVSVVYEDDNIIITDKRQGLLCHPDKNEYRDTLIARIQHYLYKSGKYDPEAEASFVPALCNRIDRNTCGLVIAAKNAVALREMCDRIKAREITKRYIAVVHGAPPEKSGELVSYLEKDEERNRVTLRARQTEQTKTAKLRYRLLAQTAELSLLEIELLTGRTHQIRAQMASVGCPLLGDGKYGKNAADRKNGYSKQALCSYYLRFDFSEGPLGYLQGKELFTKGISFVDELFPELRSSILGK